MMSWNYKQYHSLRQANAIGNSFKQESRKQEYKENYVEKEINIIQNLSELYMFH